MIRNPHTYEVLLVLLVLLTGCTPRPSASDYPRSASYAFKDTADTHLGHLYQRAVWVHPGESGFHLLPIGPEALMMRIDLVEAAQRSVDLQYFSTRDDTTGKLLLEAVTRAAKRGVRVRMLLDDWNLDDFRGGAAALNADPHIEIRVFNPYATRDQSIFSRIGNVFSYLGQFTRRMHNKALIVDNQVAIMGGRNLGDEYFDASRDLNFRDVDIFAVGPAVQHISNNFDRYWNSDQSFPLAALDVPPPDPDNISKIQESMALDWKGLRHSSIGKKLEALPAPHQARNGNLPLIWAPAEFAADSPDKIEQPEDISSSPPAANIHRLVDRAQHEFIIFTPYFVPLDDGVKWLKKLVKRGVHVRIVTNSLSSTDMVPAQAGYGHYREALVKAGVELYEIKSVPPRPPLKSMFKPSSRNGLHAKIYLIDRKDTVIGSFNLDPRSIRLNTEQVLVIHSPELGAEVTRLFQYVTSPEMSYHVMAADSVFPPQPGALVWATQEKGQTVYYDFNPHAGFWRGLMDGIFSLLPIDNEL